MSFKTHVLCPYNIKSRDGHNILIYKCLHSLQFVIQNFIKIALLILKRFLRYEIKNLIFNVNTNSCQIED